MWTKTVTNTLYVDGGLLGCDAVLCVVSKVSEKSIVTIQKTTINIFTAVLTSTLKYIIDNIARNARKIYILLSPYHNSE
jgi:hypothetical protein